MKFIYYPEVEIMHEHEITSYKSRKMLLIHIKSALTIFLINGVGFLIRRDLKQNKKLKKLYK